MGHGIGPQGLGASGMNPKSTACGHPKITPLDFNATLEEAALDGKLNKPFEKKVLANMEKKTKNNSPENNSPIDFNAFENADPRAAVNMMSDMAPTGGGNTMVNSGPGQAAMGIAPGDTARPQTGGFGGIAGGIGSILKRKAGRTGRGAGAVAATNNQRKRMLSQLGNAGPTVNSPGGGAGGAVASAEAAQASADEANSQIDALKEKLSGIRNLLNQTAGMV